MKAHALEHTDVHGKKLYYISIFNGYETHFINVGEKTFNKGKTMEEWNNTQSTGEPAPNTLTKKPGK